MVLVLAWMVQRWSWTFHELGFRRRSSMYCPPPCPSLDVSRHLSNTYLLGSAFEEPSKTNAPPQHAQPSNLNILAPHSISAQFYLTSSSVSASWHHRTLASPSLLYLQAVHTPEFIARIASGLEQYTHHALVVFLAFLSRTLLVAFSHPSVPIQSYLFGFAVLGLGGSGRFLTKPIFSSATSYMRVNCSEKSWRGPRRCLNPTMSFITRSSTSQSSARRLSLMLHHCRHSFLGSHVKLCTNNNIVCAVRATSPSHDTTTSFPFSSIAALPTCVDPSSQRPPLLAS